MSFAFPDPVLTDRLILRPWRRADAAMMKATIDANLEHIRGDGPAAAGTALPSGDRDQLMTD